MRRGWRQLVLCVRTLVAPHEMWSAVAVEPHTAIAIACVGGLDALSLTLQSFVLWPAFAGDPLVLDAPSGAQAALRGFCAARGAAIALAPASTAVRATALGVLLYASCGRQQRLPPVGVLVALAAYAEIIPWIENAALTIAIAIAAPHDLDSLRAIQLRTGLDLLWESQSTAWQPWLAATYGSACWMTAGSLRLSGTATTLVSIRRASLLPKTGWLRPDGAGFFCMPAVERTICNRFMGTTEPSGRFLLL